MVFVGPILWKICKKLGLKTSGNHSSQCWSNKILVLLCEGPQPPNAMIYGFVSPWEPLFMDLGIPKYFLKSEKYGGHLNFTNKIV